MHKVAVPFLPTLLMPAVLILDLVGSCMIPSAGWTQAIAPTIIPANDGTGTQITQQGNQWQIQGGVQTGSNLFHSFQRFGLESGQIANFLAQPGIQNILSRVSGGEASLIDGLLRVSGANANLYLINPAGMVFGANARLDVPASFTATTATGIGFPGGWFNAFGANDYARLSGMPISLGFDGASPGSVVNHGELSVNQGQSIHLLGGVVLNTGKLEAAGGTIAIAAIPGTHLVRLSQSGQILSLDLPINQSLPNPVPREIHPFSLPQLLTGGAASHASSMVVNPDGSVQLRGSDLQITTTPGSAIASGTLNTTNLNVSDLISSGNGGIIQVLGNQIQVINANLEASGITGGGQILIGGDRQGHGTLPQAHTTWIGATSTLTANALANSHALSSGNGGQIILWSTHTTHFAGSITAQGFSQDSHTLPPSHPPTLTPPSSGGFVETSSQQSLIIAPTAKVNTTAPSGQVGTWLLDPAILEVVASGGTGAIAGGTNNPTTATTIDAATIVAALNTTNVNLQATNEININAKIDASSNVNANNLTLTSPNLNLNAPIVLTNGSTLSGTGMSIKVGSDGLVQNGVDAAASGATVNLVAATYVLPATVVIGKNLTVQGAGAAQTIISGNNSLRVFDIGDGTITLQDLAIAHGRVNITGDNTGAGVLYHGNGTLTIRNSLITHNTASGIGGGILKSATNTLNLINTTVADNTASNGGGVYVQRGTTNIIGSTIANNTATTSGGGIRSVLNGTVLNITNSTISGNRANQNGGGIANGVATVNILHSTITDNLADANSGNTGNGGGIFLTTGAVTLQNTIVAGNRDASPSGGTFHPDLSGSFIDQGNNLIGVDTGNGFTNGMNGNQVGAIANPLDAKLTPLSNYGGSTPTHALLPDSPALNTAATPPTVTTDQRGISRSNNGLPDIGAFESAGYTIAVAAGSHQSTPIHNAFGTLIQVRVTENGFQAPLPGIEVTLGIPTSGASSITNPITLRTNTAGIAAFQVTANATPGSYFLTGTANGIPGIAQFRLTNLPAVESSLERSPGSTSSFISRPQELHIHRSLQLQSTHHQNLDIFIPSVWLCLLDSPQTPDWQIDLDRLFGTPLPSCLRANKVAG